MQLTDWSVQAMFYLVISCKRCIHKSNMFAVVVLVSYFLPVKLCDVAFKVSTTCQLSEEVHVINNKHMIFSLSFLIYI